MTYAEVEAPVTCAEVEAPVAKSSNLVVVIVSSVLEGSNNSYGTKGDELLIV